MTDQHPLTNKALEDLENSLVKSVMGQLVLPSDFNLARAAADWQLEQVIEWWKMFLIRTEMIPPPVVNLIIEDFKQEMRPTTTLENN